jgi:hypothetical protein
MTHHTAARADRFSAALARLLLFFSAVLALLGAAALTGFAVLPAWALVFALPDLLAVAVFAFTRLLTPLPDPRIHAGGVLWR